MPILQVFFSRFFSSFNDIQIWAWSGAAICTKTKLTCYLKNRPLCFDVIAKCYKRHRFLPSAALWALSILPQWHLCLPFTRIIHRYSESEREWRRSGENDKRWSNCSEAKHNRLRVKNKKREGGKLRMYVHKHERKRVRMKCVREKEKGLALCSANSQ